MKTGIVTTLDKRRISHITHFCSSLNQLWAVWPWASHSISLRLSFFVNRQGTTQGTYLIELERWLNETSHAWYIAGTQSVLTVVMVMTETTLTMPMMNSLSLTGHPVISHPHHSATEVPKALVCTPPLRGLLEPPGTFPALFLCSFVQMFLLSTYYVT